LAKTDVHIELPDLDAEKRKILVDWLARLIYPEIKREMEGKVYES
jgi:hypothetical protein